MTDSHKRALLRFSLRLTALAASASAALLAGCGQSSNSDAGAPGASSAASAAAAAPAATPAAGPLKVGFFYVGPVGDGGWSFAHDNARKALEKDFGDKIATTFVENVNEGPDAERVIRDLVQQGNTLIFGTSFGFMESMVKVAADNPNVKFEHATGYKTAANLGTYDARTYEGAYMAGVVAGKMSKSGVLGVVGSVPIPEVIRNIDSFTLGAQVFNPKAKVRVVWVGDWHNPPKETEAATALINGGADVLMQNTDSPAVIKTAESMGKRAFGWDSDMTAYGPKAHLGSAVINWEPYYKKVTQDVLDNTWKPEQVWWGVKEGAIDFVSIADDVPQEVKDKLNEVKSGLKDSSYVIWKGPLKDNTGKQVLAQGQTADDTFLRSINFYVPGVEGKVPGGQK
ncbi:MAG: BMP family ABC transporter substrate-binding protein [Burkholderiaceae bacterium]|jgi:simple sugar transport system substrate-binding protein|nr:BMP family ABC transporter substrate-binding protein [Burkholderiaceae bacterium]